MLAQDLCVAPLLSVESQYFRGVEVRDTEHVRQGDGSEGQR